MAVFNQNAPENKQRIRVQYLDPDALYNVISAVEGKIVARLKGKDLSEQGFEVFLKNGYTGSLFEITKQ